MNDKSRVTAIVLCFLMLFQAQAYAEETHTYSLTSKEEIQFDGTAEETCIEAGDVITYSPNNTNTGSFAKLTLPKGEYILECYGAKSSNTIPGGYSKGTYKTKKATDLYLYCGGIYSQSSKSGGSRSGAGGSSKNSNGYNGGGPGAGGATHIATEEGLLKAREKDYKDTLLIVAGGAGAGGGGTGGGSTGSNGKGYSSNGYYNSSSVSGSYTAAKGGSQKEGGSGGTAKANYSTASGKKGSFGQGGEGNYGGGGGFYGGGSGTSQVTGGKWVYSDNGNSGNYISATAYAYGAGGSGYINTNLITDGSTSTGKTSTSRTSTQTNATNGKIIITCIEASCDYYTNKLFVPSQVAVGSTFMVRSESEFNTKYRTIVEVKYQIKSDDELLLEKKATLDEETTAGANKTEKYSGAIKMPSCDKDKVTLEVSILYSDGEKVSLTRDILISKSSAQYNDEIRYVGQGFELDEKSKWMTDEKLSEKLRNSLSRTEPEEIRNLN